MHFSERKSSLGSNQLWKKDSFITRVKKCTRSPIAGALTNAAGGAGQSPLYNSKFLFFLVAVAAVIQSVTLVEAEQTEK